MVDELSTDDYLPCHWLPRDALTPNQWNPNDMDEREKELLKKSILNHSWTAPIVIRADEHVIVDGEQRWTVAGDETIQTDSELTPPDVPAGHVPVLPVELSEDEARVATIQHNRAHGSVETSNMEQYVDAFDADELTEMGMTDSDVYDLIDEHPDTDEIEDELASSDEIDVDDVIEDDDSDDELLPTPAVDSLSVMCSPDEAALVRAVLQDGETLDEYVDYLVRLGLINNFRRLVDD